MPDLRKAVRLAGELAEELEAQDQMDGALGETLEQFLGESEELIELADSLSEGEGSRRSG